MFSTPLTPFFTTVPWTEYIILGFTITSIASFTALRLMFLYNHYCCIPTPKNVKFLITDNHKINQNPLWRSEQSLLVFLYLCYWWHFYIQVIQLTLSKIIDRRLSWFFSLLSLTLSFPSLALLARSMNVFSPVIHPSLKALTHTHHRTYSCGFLLLEILHSVTS